MDAREALKAAVEARNAENAIYEETAAALSRARDLLDKAQRELATYVDLDEAIAAHRVNSVREALASGQDLPTLDKLPKYLADRQDARDRVARTVAALSGAVADLERDSDGKRVKVTDAAVKAELAAENVLIEQADALAREFDQALDKARRLWLDLHAIRGQQVTRTAADGPAPAPFGVEPRLRRVRLPDSALVALAQNIGVPDWEFKAGAGVGKAAQAKWDSTWRGLLA